jgi:hypothetical protein
MAAVLLQKAGWGGAGAGGGVAGGGTEGRRFVGEAMPARAAAFANVGLHTSSN